MELEQMLKKDLQAKAAELKIEYSDTDTKAVLIEKIKSVLDKVDDVVEDVADVIEDSVEKIEDIVEDVKEATEDVVENIKEKAEELSHEVKNIYIKVKQRWINAGEYIDDKILKKVLRKRGAKEYKIE